MLVPEVDTVYTEPFHISTQLASLDYVSGGRAGWLVAASDQAADAAAVGRSLVSADGLGREAADSIEVSRRLWDSWEDDAVIRDVATGRYLDADKLHYVDFESADGTATPSRARPSFPGRCRDSCRSWRRRACWARTSCPPGRRTPCSSPRPTPELLAGEIADARAAAPAAADHRRARRRPRRPRAKRRRRVSPNWTRTPRGRAAAPVSSAPPPELTELLASVLETADGVRLHPAVLDVDLEELAQLVLPALRRRGVLAPQQPGSTFRDLLGLQRPASRYAAATAGDQPLRRASAADN